MGPKQPKTGFWTLPQARQGEGIMGITNPDLGRGNGCGMTQKEMSVVSGIVMDNGRGMPFSAQKGAN